MASSVRGQTAKNGQTILTRSAWRSAKGNDAHDYRQRMGVQKVTEHIVTKSAWPRIARALSLLALGAALIVSTALPVAAPLMGETPRANFAFALIVSSVLVAVAVSSSYGASLRIQQIARIAWVSVAVACLVFAQYLLSFGYPDAHKAADTVLLIAMFILSFPAGGIVAIGFTFVYSSLLLSDRGVGSLDLAIFWSTFFAFGYLQWFKLVPWLIEKWRTHKKTNPA